MDPDHISLSDVVVQCAQIVYGALGSGHTEIVYHRAMEVELRARGVRYETKVILPIEYRGLNVGYGEADLVVYQDTMDTVGVVVELKAVTYAPRAQERAQIASYIRLRCDQVYSPNGPSGVLINFRQPTVSNPVPDGIDWEFVVLDKGIEFPLSSKEKAQPDDQEQDQTEGKCS